MAEVKLFQKAKTSKVKTWTIKLVGNSVTVVWGVVDGKMQETTQVFKPLNIGKANEKTSEQVAREWMDRQVLLQKRKGYSESIEEETEINWSKGIPSNARFYKPLHGLSKTIEKCIMDNEAIYVRKMNGVMFAVLTKDDATIQMYSSTMSPVDKQGVSWTERFPSIIESIRKMDLPPRSIILGELTVLKDRTESLEDASGLINATKETSLEMQRSSKNSKVIFFVWDIVYYNGESYHNKEAKDRFKALYELINKMAHKGTSSGSFHHVSTPEYFKGEPSAKMLDLAKKNKWEGYVVVDPTSTLDDQMISFRGSHERAKGCAKLKPLYDADFIIRWDPDNGIGTWGKGKKSAGVGALFAYLLDDQGNEVFVSKVGGGISMVDKDGEEAMMTKLADPSIYPLVAKIEFTSVTKNGSIQFPQFVSLREDKVVQECTMDQLSSIHSVDLG